MLHNNKDISASNDKWQTSLAHRFKTMSFSSRLPFVSFQNKLVQMNCPIYQMDVWKKKRIYFFLNRNENDTRFSSRCILFGWPMIGQWQVYFEIRPNDKRVDREKRKKSHASEHPRTSVGRYKNAVERIPWHTGGFSKSFSNVEHCFWLDFMF